MKKTPQYVFNSNKKTIICQQKYLKCLKAFFSHVFKQILRRKKKVFTYFLITFSDFFSDFEKKWTME